MKFQFFCFSFKVAFAMQYVHVLRCTVMCLHECLNSKRGL